MHERADLEETRVTPAAALARVLPRWRARVSSRFAAAEIDDFIRRHRQALEALVAGALARRKAERGELPDTAVEFAAFDPIVAWNRRHNAGSDRAIFAWLRVRVETMIARGQPEPLVLRSFAVPFVDMRAEAIVLRKAGWDPVVLFISQPAVAFVVGGAVVALRDFEGRVAIHPDRRGRLNQLFFDLERAEKWIGAVHEASDTPFDTTERLQRFAESLWTRARST